MAAFANELIGGLLDCECEISECVLRKFTLHLQLIVMNTLFLSIK